MKNRKKRYPLSLPESICPICGKAYRDYPALSRVDNMTEICPECGTVQGLEACGVDYETIKSVLQEIHKTFNESDRCSE